MDKNMLHDDTVWTKENYKNALKMTQLISKPMKVFFDSKVEEKIKRLPFVNLQKFYKSLPNKEFKLLPYRVYGLAKNQAEHILSARSDIGMASFTIYSKHAFATMFIYVMTDTMIQKDEFIQVSIERIYSNKKGYGIKLMKHIMNKAEKNSVTITMWNENEKLKDYFVSCGFKYRYKSVTTGHYFLTYQL